MISEEMMMHWIPRRWTLVGLLLAMMLTMSPVAMAQVTMTQVADTVYRADGTTATGTVVISWPEFTTAAGQSIPAGSTSVTIAAGGALEVQLAPNAGSNPMGSYYTVVYHLDDGSVSHQYWVVPASGNPVKISTISSTVMPLSVAQQTVSKSYVDTAIAEAVTGVTPGNSSVPYVLKAGDTMMGSLVLSGDPTAAGQAADKHYVDTSVQQVAAGVGQKISLLPQATQVVAQPTGTQLEINNLNSVEYATQYLSGNGNNAVANAVASPDCAAGCDVKVEKSYTSNEVYHPSTWNDRTHVEDMRLGGKRDSFINPNNALDSSASGQTLDLVTTRNSGIVGQSVVSATPFAVALSVSHEALAGGSNLFPQSIEGAVPYFKSTFLAQQQIGTYHTMGQHGLSSQVINCFGVGDCLIGQQTILASGGIRDEADEGAHPFDLQFSEDSRVFVGTCASGCSTGATSLMVAATSDGGTQGEGRYLINKNPAKTISNGLLIGGGNSPIYPTATFSGTSFPVSVFFATAQMAPSQANNVSPGTVTLAIATSGVTAGFATNTAAAPSPNGIACIADQNPPGSSNPPNYEMVPYTVVDGTHLQLTLNKVHAALSTVAIGGLCGYGIEQTVDTKKGIRQVFPVVGSYSPTGLYYAGGQTPIVGLMEATSGFLNVSSNVATIVRNNNVVTVTAAANFPMDINGLSMTVAGVADSSYNGTFPVTTTSANTLTYAQTGPNSTSSSGTVSFLTGSYVLYPMAEVLGVMNPATKLVDGQMTLAPNTVAWATGDVVEQPHYYQELLEADTQYINQTSPRPTTMGGGGINFSGTNSSGLVGWQITNESPLTSYLGNGGTYEPPYAAYEAQGVWRNAMVLEAGQDTAFTVTCNDHGCDRWNSAYNLFELYNSAGVDVIRYDPQSSTMNMGLRGTNYQFSPQAFSAATINANTINASVINGSVSGNSITSGAVDAAYLPKLGASGSAHAAGIVPDPGATGGTTRFLREDGTWSAPTTGATNTPGLLSGATADYNFLQGSGTTVPDLSGNGNNATFASGSAAPTWTSTGLSFIPAQGVSLPATLNATQTFFLAVYINPLTAGNQPYTNSYDSLISSTTGGTGFNLLAAENFGVGTVSEAYAPTVYSSGVATASAPPISGFHVLAVTLGAAASGTLDHLYVDGMEVSSYSRQSKTAGAQTSGNLYLGSSGVSPWNTSGIWGTVYRLRTYATALTAAQVQQVSGAITTEIASRGVATTPILVPGGGPQLHAIGDSITAGQGVSNPWPTQLALTNQPAYNVTDWGISGITMDAISTSEPNRVGLRCRTNNGPAIAIVFAGTNDFGGIIGVTPSTVFQKAAGEVQTLKQAGCRVFLGTMISRGGNDAGGSTLLDADKDAYDTLILGQAKANGADGIIDFAANPLLGADGASASATYFQGDHTHPTQTGQNILAAEASNALNYYFGYNETNPHTVTSLNYTMTAADGYISLSGLTGAGTLTLPDCTGQSGATYRINNPQAAFAVSAVPWNANQPINGLGSITVPANGTLTLRDTPNPKTVSGCHWEM